MSANIEEKIHFCSISQYELVFSYFLSCRPRDDREHGGAPARRLRLRDSLREPVRPTVILPHGGRQSTSGRGRHGHQRG